MSSDAQDAGIRCYDAAAASRRRNSPPLLGPRGYLDRPEDLLLYEYDGSVDKARPEMVVFPRTTEDVVAIVKIAARAQDSRSSAAARAPA